jgi:hypothetical protein
MLKSWHELVFLLQIKTRSYNELGMKHGLAIRHRYRSVECGDSSIDSLIVRTAFFDCSSDQQWRWVVGCRHTAQLLLCDRHGH